MKTGVQLLGNFVIAVWICAAGWFRASEGVAVSAVATADPATGAATVASETLATNITEVIHLSESGLEEEVVLAFIETCQVPFALSAEVIVYLKDIGISAEIITAMLHRDAVLREQGIEARTLSTNQFVDDQKLSQQATNIPTPSPQAVYVTNAPLQVVHFYDSLAPYGTWIDLEGYGWCWQPRLVAVHHYWQPYWHGGYWIYTDCGWYWRSDYSWGWAPFHYGRWHRHHRHGWVWFPDLVWAPAWVSWRYSDRYCGWAPLPPGAHFVGHGWRFNNVSVGLNFDFHLGPDLFTFVEIRHLHERHPHLHAVPAAQAKEIAGRTTIANNYVVGQNNRIINQGVAVERVTAASGRAIRSVTIKEAPTPSGGVIRPDRLVKEGSESVLYRPELKPPVKSGPLIAQKIDQSHAIVRPMPQRPSDSALPRGSALGLRPVPPASLPPARTPLQGTESRPRTPAPTPKVAPEPPKRLESMPVGPRPIPLKPIQPPTGSAAQQPVQPAVPRHTVSPPARFESPRGREQRLSNGSKMQQPSPPAGSPPSSRPPQKGNGFNPLSPAEPKNNYLAPNSPEDFMTSQPGWKGLLHFTHFPLRGALQWFDCPRVIKM